MLRNTYAKKCFLLGLAHTLGNARLELLDALVRLGFGGGTPTDTTLSTAGPILLRWRGATHTLLLATGTAARLEEGSGTG